MLHPLIALFKNCILSLEKSILQTERSCRGVGFRDRPRVPGEAGLGRRVRPRGGRATRPRLAARAVRATGRRKAQGDRSTQGAGARAGPVGDPSGPGTRWQRPRSGETRSAQRDLGPLVVGADRLRLPGAGYRKRRDHRALRDGRAEAAVSAAPAGGRTLLLLLDDRTAGRRRSDPVPHPRGARRRRLAHRRLEVLLLQRPNGFVPDRHGDHRPGRQPLPGHVHVPGARRHSGDPHRP